MVIRRSAEADMDRPVSHVTDTCADSGRAGRGGRGGGGILNSPARTRLRLHWAPGIPRALYFQRARDSGKPRAKARGENEYVCLRRVGKAAGARECAREVRVPTIPRKRWARREMRLCPPDGCGAREPRHEACDESLTAPARS